MADSSEGLVPDSDYPPSAIRHLLPNTQRTPMNHRHSIALLLPLLLLVACGKPADKAAATPPAEKVATVNGKPISKSEYELYLASIARQSGRDIPEDQKAQLLDQYISMHLAAEEAE